MKNSEEREKKIYYAQSNEVTVNAQVEMKIHVADIFKNHRKQPVAIGHQSMSIH